jgi:hypothetical protein
MHLENWGVAVSAPSTHILNELGIADFTTEARHAGTPCRHVVAARSSQLAAARPKDRQNRKKNPFRHNRQPKLDQGPGGQRSAIDGRAAGAWIPIGGVGLRRLCQWT